MEIDRKKFDKWVEENNMIVDGEHEESDVIAVKVCDLLDAIQSGEFNEEQEDTNAH